jgi:phage gp29-like protein
VSIISRLLRTAKTEPQVDAARVSNHMMSLWSPLEHMTPRTLAAALNYLRAGELQAYAQLWDEARVRDDILASVVPKRSRAVSRLSYEIVSADDTPDASRQKEIAEAFFADIDYTDCMDADQSGGMQALVRAMMLAIGHGWSCQEIVWRPSPGGLSAEFRQVPLSFFERRAGRLRYLRSEGAYDGSDLEPGGWLVTSCQDRLAIASLVLYLFKHTPLRDWLIYCHRYVVPGLHGKTPAQKGSTDWTDLHDALANFGQDWALQTGKDVDIETINSSAQGELPYAPLVDRCDRRMTAIWRGADLSTMSAGDATGASLQGGETDVLTADDAAMISDTINRRLLPYVLRYTLGNVAPLIKFRLQCPNPQTMLDLKVDEAMIGWGVEISKADLRERYSRAAPDKGEDVASRPAPSLAPAGGFPAPNAALPQSGNPIFKALAADLQPLRTRLAAALDLSDGEMEAELARLAHAAPALFRAMDEGGALPAALARDLAQRFVDGISNGLEDQDA